MFTSWLMSQVFLFRIHGICPNSLNCEYREGGRRPDIEEGRSWGGGQRSPVPPRHPADASVQRVIFRQVWPLVTSVRHLICVAGCSGGRLSSPAGLVRDGPAR